MSNFPYTPDWETRTENKGKKWISIYNCKCGKALNKTRGKDYEDRSCKSCLDASMSEHNKQLDAIKKCDCEVCGEFVFKKDLIKVNLKEDNSDTLMCVDCYNAWIEYAGTDFEKFILSWSKKSALLKSVFNIVKP